VTINQGDNEAHQVQVQVQHLTKTTDFQLLVQDEQNARYILKPVQPIMANELLVNVEQAKEYKAKAEKLSKAVSVFEQENIRLRQLVAEQQKKIDALEKEQRTQQKQIVPPINLQVDLKKTQGIDERPYSPTVLYYKK
jgi:aminoglycoside phosphotransferase family enzyme